MMLEIGKHLIEKGGVFFIYSQYSLPNFSIASFSSTNKINKTPKNASHPPKNTAHNLVLSIVMDTSKIILPNCPGCLIQE